MIKLLEGLSVPADFDEEAAGIIAETPSGHPQPNVSNIPWCVEFNRHPFTA